MIVSSELGFESWSQSCTKRMLLRKGLDTGSFETARSQIARITQGRCQFFTDSPKRFANFGYADASIGTTKLQFLSWQANEAECGTATVRERDFMLYIPLEGSFQAQRGASSIRTDPGQLLLVSSDGELTRRWTGPLKLLNVIIPRRTISRLLATDFAIGADEQFDFSQFATLPASESGTLLRLIDAYLLDLESDRSAFLHPSAGQHAEKAFLHALLRLLPTNGAYDLRSSPTTAPKYLQRAEAYILRNIGSEMTLDDVIDAAAASARTVYYGFRNFRKTTPQRYIKHLRLKLARDALLDASPGRDRISEIGLRFGYLNFAQFSKDYKQMYGVTPSATLRERQ
jgi:AraC-like DNA-binding protein